MSLKYKLFIVSLVMTSASGAAFAGVDSGGVKALPTKRITFEGAPAVKLMEVLKRSGAEYHQGFEGGYWVADFVVCNVGSRQRPSGGFQLVYGCQFDLTSNPPRTKSNQDGKLVIDILRHVGVPVHTQFIEGAQWQLTQLNCASESVFKPFPSGHFVLRQACTVEFEDRSAQ